MSNSFEFLDPGTLIDRDLELVLIRRVQADPSRGYVPYYEFEMRHPNSTVPMGTIRVRIGSARKLHFPGQIGYEVYEPYRGHRYAARSCRLVLPLAQAHELKAVWLTVDPKNTPSRKTCEIIGAKYVETVRVPKDVEMYQSGARYRRRYRLDLPKTL